MLTRVLGVLVGVICMACQSPSDDSNPSGEAGELAQLLNNVEDAKGELKRIEAEVEKHREEVRFLSCQAGVEEFNAELSLAHAACTFELAEHARCDAQVEREKGDAAWGGCGFGFAIALATGGSAAPWALGGCLAGRTAGELSAAECPTPQCREEHDQRYREALAKRSWQQLPQCGGGLGIQVETPLIGLVRVLRVVNPGTLKRAGVQEGDAIAYVGAIRVKTAEELQAQLAASAGREVEIRYVRSENLYIGKTTLPDAPSSTRYAVESQALVQHRWGARVVSIDAGSPLAGAGLDGKDFVGIDGQEVMNADHLRDLLRYRRTGETIEAKFRTPKSQNTEDATFTLVGRQVQWSL